MQVTKQARRQRRRQIELARNSVFTSFAARDNRALRISVGELGLLGQPVPDEIAEMVDKILYPPPPAERKRKCRG